MTQGFSSADLKSVNVLFVCMGNICRSPTAHGVFQQLVKQNKFDEFVFVDSAGTYDYHIGKRPDKRSAATAATRGYDLSDLRARQVKQSDFQDFDYILAMDNENYSDLIAQSHEEYKDKVNLFLEYAKKADINEVPDPYYGGPNGFETVLDLVEEASKGLLEHIKVAHLAHLAHLSY